MKPYRLFIYYRQGYSFYTAFVLGIVSSLIIIYKLAVEGTPLQLLFPSLGVFSAAAVLISLPVNIFLGRWHAGRDRGLSAEYTLALETMLQPRNRELLLQIYRQVKADDQK